MTQAAHSILKNALSLTEKDRALLAGVLLESLESDHEDGVDEAWLAEVELRVAELNSGEVQTLHLETVMSRLKRQIRG